MTRQQELELLAEWLGIEYWVVRLDPRSNPVIKLHRVVNGETVEWNPLTNDTDFLNMVAGRVDIEWLGDVVFARHTEWMHLQERVESEDHNNDKLAAMKHAAYQVCLMAAREWKEAAR